MDRNAQNGVHQRRGAIARQSEAAQAVEFFNVLTSPALLETTESILPEHRQRLYPPTVVRSMFMRQGLEPSARARRRAMAGQRSAQPMVFRHAAFVPALAAGRDSICPGDGPRAHAPNGPLAQPQGAGAMAVARAHGQAGGRRRDLDARYPGESSGLSAARHPAAWSGRPAGAAGHGDLPGHQRGARCGGGRYSSGIGHDTCSSCPSPASQPVPMAYCATQPGLPDRSGDSRSRAAAISPAACPKPNPAPTASSLRGASQ